MKGLLALLLFIALAVLSWGVYGPVLQLGKQDMQGSALRPFICVGLAYFLIAVLAPGVLLRMAGETGHWSSSGIFWSLAAGAAGAIGALGIILAFLYRGSPVYVMPLVFGCAPVVNTFLTMYWARSYKQASPIFFAGLILVIAGAMIVLSFRPHRNAGAEKVAVQQTDTPAAVDTAKQSDSTVPHPGWDRLLVFAFTAMTALAWGVYGPTLHRGQTAMAGSRLRPFLCVGLAYFLIAVIVPTLLLTKWEEPSDAFGLWRRPGDQYLCQRDSRGQLRSIASDVLRGPDRGGGRRGDRADLRAQRRRAPRARNPLPVHTRSRSSLIAAAHGLGSANRCSHES
ncbi:MAG: hypothetical protein HY288_05685 [Planctomycetia bacterium]|nr:hypothetical protein [Planctomycetia bacterium]